ncbi:MAG: type II toxin-antitoxin system VapC family toxin [Candidatus Aenigmarchaeota archaeon]|nr:type II toxin-antitoxin system VapC family toxin [Candidatus Aenigmarchaeota archaeon]
MIVLDTDVLIELERENEQAWEGLNRLRQAQVEPAVITAPVFAESLFGFIVKGRRQEGEDFLSAFPVIPFEQESAARFAELRHALEKRGTPIPLFDVLTASSVLAAGGTLLSRDRHFAQVPGLRLIRPSW